MIPGWRSVYYAPSSRKHALSHQGKACYSGFQYVGLLMFLCMLSIYTIICVGVKRMHQFMREGLGPTLWLLLDEHGIAESCQRYAA